MPGRNRGDYHTKMRLRPRTPGAYTLTVRTREVGTMRGTHRTRWAPAVAIALAASAAVAEEPLKCRAYLVLCNVGAYYSGTVRYRAVVEARSPSGGAPERTVTEFSVRVDKGKAVCEGTTRGPGLFVVEFGRGTDDDPEQSWYRVAVACPGDDGRPANLDSSNAFETYKRPGKDQAPKLEGSSDEPAPEVDEVNGVTGTVHLEWSLSRPAGAGG